MDADAAARRLESKRPRMASLVRGSVKGVYLEPYAEAPLAKARKYLKLTQGETEKYKMPHPWPRPLYVVRVRRGHAALSYLHGVGDCPDIQPGSKQDAL